MTRLSPFLLILAVAGCEDIVLPGLAPPPSAPEAPPARILPAAVSAALLPGVPESIVVEDGQGCYLVSNVITEPRQGYLVRDATGEALCFDAAGNRISRPVPPVLPPVETTDTLPPPAAPA